MNNGSLHVPSEGKDVPLSNYHSNASKALRTVCEKSMLHSKHPLLLGV